MENIQSPTSVSPETKGQLIELAAEAFARILWQQIRYRASKLKDKKRNNRNQKSDTRAPRNLSNFRKSRFQKAHVEPILDGSDKC